jgi:RimJ/RimL family protein N-acetyltransferase
MKLEVLTLNQCEQIRQWRNKEMEVWRTPFMLTEEMQIDFYHKMVCDRNSPHRYWAIIAEEEKYSPEKIAEQQAKLLIKPLGFLGMGGITYIQWENRIGEITLIIDPAQRKNGLGERAVDLLLDQAFNHLNLQTVFGECYCCNSAQSFWLKIVRKYNDGLGCESVMPNRKYWQGKYYPSLYFSIDKDEFNNRNKQG